MDYNIFNENNSIDLSDINHDMQTDEPSLAKIIKVIGVGGGGCNAINHMYSQDIEGVTYVVANTDWQALTNSPVPTKLLLGPTITKGLGAGNKPEVAKNAAEESEKEIEALFDDETKMVFITAGMGGGTGTGAAPVVARIAREKGVLTVGIVTLPFGFEGQKKIAKAIEGADEMEKYVDALLVINNQRLADIYQDLDFDNGFDKANDTLTIAARSISELITSPGKVNLDFKDVETTLQNGGPAIISSGYGEGEHRVTKAIENALNSPLLKNRNVEGSKHILINVSYDPDVENNKFTMGEVTEIDDFMLRFAPDLDVITGFNHDKTLGEKIKITILASGFDVSLASDVKPASAEQSKRSASTSPEKKTPSAETPGDKIINEYGAEYVDRIRKNKERAKYFVFTPDEFNCDDLLSLFETAPTFTRDAAIKSRFESIRREYKDLKEGKQALNNPANDSTTIVFS